MRVVIDTNTLLEFASPEQIDWCALLGATTLTIVVTPVVLRELQNAKDGNRSSSKRKTAAARIAQLESLLSDGDSELGGAPSLRPGVALTYQSKALSPDIFAQYSLDPSLSDDRLVAYALRERDCGADIALVSDDAGLRLTARSLGVRACSIPDRFRNPKGKAERESLPAPRIEVSLKKASYCDIVVRPPPTPERVKLFLQEVEDFLDVRWFDAPEEGSFYRSKIAESDHARTKAAFLKRLEVAIAARSRALTAGQLSVFVRNRGLRTATGVRIDIGASEPGAWDFPDWEQLENEAPWPLQLPSPYSTTLPRLPFRRSPGKWFGNSRWATIKLDHVYHDPGGSWMSVGGPTLWVRDHTVGGLKLEVEVKSPELARPIQSELHVRLVHEPPEDLSLDELASHGLEDEPV